MTIRKALYGCLLLLAGSISSSTLAGGTLLIIGDSLSDAYGMARESGWAAQLENRLGAEYTVINASISGDTTASGLNRLSPLLAQRQPDWLLIILGGNDGLRALSPNQLRSNLERMIELAQDAGIEVALMQIRLPPNLGPAYLRRFEGVYPELAEQHGITLLPFFLESVFDRPGMMMDDGIHPTVEAQELMLNALWPSLRAWMNGEWRTEAPVQ